MPVGQGLLRGRGLPEDRPARAGDAVGGRALRGGHRAHARRAHRPLADPVRRPRDLHGDPGGRHDRRLPDREPRADGLAAAHAPRDARRPHDPGGDRAPGPDPGRRRQPLHRAPPAAARGPGLRGPLRPPVARAGAARHARHDHLPGPGDRGRDGVRGLLAGRGRGAAAGDEPQALGGGDRGLPPALRRGRGAHPRGRRGAGRARLRDGHRLLGLRLPQGPRRRVRPARLPVDLAARALRPGVPVRAAQRAADGLLPAGHARPRGPAPRDRGAGAPTSTRARSTCTTDGEPTSASASATSSACAPTRSPRWWRRARRAGRSARSATSPRAPGRGGRRSSSWPGRARATRCARATAPPAARCCGSSGSPRRASRSGTARSSRCRSSSPTRRRCASSSRGRR